MLLGVEFKVGSISGRRPVKVNYKIKVGRVGVWGGRGSAAGMTAFQGCRGQWDSVGDLSCGDSRCRRIRGEI